MRQVNITLDGVNFGFNTQCREGSIRFELERLQRRPRWDPVNQVPSSGLTHTGFIYQLSYSENITSPCVRLKKLKAHLNLKDNLLDSHNGNKHFGLKVT